MPVETVGGLINILEYAGIHILCGLMIGLLVWGCRSRANEVAMYKRA